MIERIAEFCVKKRWVIVVIVIFITFFSFSQFKNLVFYNKLTDWLSKDNPRLSLFINASEEFAINDLVMVIVKPEKGVFNSKTLTKLKKFTESMKEKKEIFMVSSIGNISDIRKIEDGIEVKDLLDKIPNNEKSLKKISKYILSKEIYKNNIISSDGKLSAISIFISNKYDPIGVVKRIIIPESKKYFGNTGKIYYSGMPSDGYFLNKFTVRDLKTLTPMIVILILLILYISFKSFKGVAFPSVVVIFSVIWLFGLMGLLHKPLTLITPAIPVLLIALGSAYGIHVLNKYVHGIRGDDNKEKRDQLIKATTEIFIPVLLAGVTTLVGFVSFITANLSLIADFGIFSAIGILFALIIALTLIPAFSSFANFNENEETSKGNLAKIIENFADFVIKERKIVFILSFGLIIFFSIGIFKVNREVNFSEYYPDNSQPRKGLKVSEKNFKGAYPVLFYIKSANSKSPDILRIMRRSEDFILSNKNLSLPYSIVEIIEELNDKLNGRFSIPEHKNGIGNLWFFMDGRDEVKQILSSDNKDAIVFAKMSDSSTNINKKLFYKIDKFLKVDLKKTYYKYKLDKYDYYRGLPIRYKESEYLCNDIVWIGEHYTGKTIERDKILKPIKNILKMKISFSNDSIIRTNFSKFLNDYITGDEFDFEVKRKSGGKIIKDILKLLSKDTLTKKKIIKVLSENIRSDDFDKETAKDIANTIFYKLDEIIKDYKASLMWKAINNNFGSHDKDFKKRVNSILYDINDNLAVLHSSDVNGIKGEKVKLELIEQTGQPSLLTTLDESLFSSQIQSLILAYFVTLFLMIIMKRNFILGIISTLPILFTIAVMYGFLGFSNIPLDYATMMIGGISIGVGIDYAIHFIHGVSLEVENGCDFEQAVRKAFKEKGRAIITNSVAVMFGFAVLLFSSILPLRNFGGTMVGAMFLSAFATLTLLPSSLLIFKINLKNNIRRK